MRWTVLACALVVFAGAGVPQKEVRGKGAAWEANERGVGLLERGRPLQAMRAFQAGLAASPGQGALRRNYTTAATMALGRALAGGRRGAAEKVCRDALRVLGPEPRFGCQLGVILADQGRLTAALRELDRVGKEPGGGPALLVAARIERRRGKLARACERLGRAVPRLTGTLRNRAAGWLRLWRLDLRLRQGRRTRQANPLHLWLPGGADHAQGLTLERHAREGLRRAERALGRRRREPLEVVFSSRADLRALGGAAWSAGLYHDGVVRVLHRGQGGAGTTAILAHECAHALLADLSPAVPAWLHEGFAQIAEGRRPDRALRQLQAAGSPLLTAAQLERGFGHLDDPRRVALAYAQSLALTDHLLRTRRGGRGSLLQALRGTTEAEMAAGLRRWCGGSVDRMVAGLARRHGLSQGSPARPPR